jgi:hypothetical protein
MVSADATDPMILFEATGDLEVVFDDGSSMMVHSALLGLASPVFAAMFTSGMREAQTKRLELQGKDKDEFELVMSFLRPLSAGQVSVANVDVLLPWACEYQMLFLKERCEQTLLMLPCSASRLVDAKLWDLQEQYERCLTELTYVQFVGEFDILAAEGEVLVDLQPHMVEKCPSVDRLWPFLLDAATSTDLHAKLGPLLHVMLGNINALDDMSIIAMSALSGHGDASSWANLADAHFKTRTQMEQATKKVEQQRTKLESTKKSIKVAASDIFGKIPSSVKLDDGYRVDFWAKEQLEIIVKAL